MAINTNIPQPTQSLAQTQNAFLTNFNAIQAAWIVNHVDYQSTNPLAGKHTYVTMPAQTVPPGTLTTEQAIFVMNDPGSIPQIFVQAPETAGPTPGLLYNITGVYYNNPLPWTLGSKATTTLPSGIILKWGYSTVTGSGTTSFYQAFPNDCFTVQITLSIDTDRVVSVNAITPSNFTVINTRPITTTSFYWFAIGY